jgi:fatty-acyl-CoA synthase
MFIRHYRILTQYATALIGVIQVNINPAYKAYELEYSLAKVGCKGIVMYDKMKHQNYLEMLLNVCPELETSKPGNLNSVRLPLLKHVISVGKKEHHQGTIPFNKLETYGDTDTFNVLNKLSSQIQASDPINIQVIKKKVN